MRRLGLFHAARAKSAPCVFEGTVNPARCPRLHFREGGINVKLAKSPSRVPALGGGDFMYGVKVIRFPFFLSRPVIYVQSCFTVWQPGFMCLTCDACMTVNMTEYQCLVLPPDADLVRVFCIFLPLRSATF